MSAAAKRLAGKTVLVTGASSGIGRSTAAEFARVAAPAGGLRLILTARRIDTLKDIAAELAAELGDKVQVLPVQLDVSDREAVRGFVGSLPEDWRDIDVLVNNAYVSSPRFARLVLLFFCSSLRSPCSFILLFLASLAFSFILLFLASLAFSFILLFLASLVSFSSSLTLQWPRQGRCSRPRDCRGGH